MKYWYDTEFIENGRTIDLISIGVVAEDGREYYAQDADCDLSRASEWVKANVLPHLDPQKWEGRSTIRQQLLAFVGNDRPEWWGYNSAYDHVVLSQLFGTMMDLPEGWPYYTRDVKQWADQLGVKESEFPAQVGILHNALDDARWTRLVWEFLNGRTKKEIYP